MKRKETSTPSDEPPGTPAAVTPVGRDTPIVAISDEDEYGVPVAVATSDPATHALAQQTKEKRNKGS
jgi:hypothetical protein